jgi:hypothetical protein
MQIILKIVKIIILLILRPSRAQREGGGGGEIRGKTKKMVPKEFIFLRF